MQQQSERECARCTPRRAWTVLSHTDPRETSFILRWVFKPGKKASPLAQLNGKE